MRHSRLAGVCGERRAFGLYNFWLLDDDFLMNRSLLFPPKCSRFSLLWQILSISLFLILPESSVYIVSTCYRLCFIFFPHSPPHHGDGWTSVHLASFLKNPLYCTAQEELPNYAVTLFELFTVTVLVYICACVILKWNCSKAHLYELN